MREFNKWYFLFGLRNKKNIMLTTTSKMKDFWYFKRNSYRQNCVMLSVNVYILLRILFLSSLISVTISIGEWAPLLLKYTSGSHFSCFISVIILISSRVLLFPATALASNQSLRYVSLSTKQFCYLEFYCTCREKLLRFAKSVCFVVQTSILYRSNPVQSWQDCISNGNVTHNQWNSCVSFYFLIADANRKLINGMFTWIGISLWH